MAQLFRVVISGRTIGDVPLADLKADVGRAFKLQGEQLDRMLTGRPVVVSRSATAEAAEKLCARLQALGLEARIEALPETPAEIPPSPPPPAPRLKVEAAPAKADELFALTAPVAVSPGADPVANASAQKAPEAPAPVDAGVVCPKCGEAQPKRTLCRNCGLDMPRYEQARAAAEQEAREERLANLEAARESRKGGRSSRAAAGGQHASLFGIGFSGRLGRLDYFSGSIFSSTILFAFMMLAVSTGKPGLIWFGMLVSAIYGFRCIALRLHDTGRTGWLSLVIMVPVLGALMTLALLIMRGEDGDNEYGAPPPAGGGRRAIVVLLSLLVIGGLAFRTMTHNPEKMARFMQAVNAAQGGGDEAEDASSADAPAAHYSSGNRIDLYVIAACASCDRMRGWLDANGLRYTVYSVDADQHAAERLQSIVGEGQIMLPVLEINGKVLPGDPSIEMVHGYLRQD